MTGIDGRTTPAPSRPLLLLGLVVLALVGVLAVVAGRRDGAGPAQAGASPVGGDADDGAVETETTTTTAAPTTTTTTRPGPPRVHVLGDSVILGAEAVVPAALAPWQVSFDAKVSRTIDAGIDLLAGPEAQDAWVVVIHLCTNWHDDDFGAKVTQATAAVPTADRVVWVTCHPWNDAVVGANEAIRAAAAADPRIVVADWAAVSGQPGYTYKDGLHLQPDGRAAIAALVADAVGPPPRQATVDSTADSTAPGGPPR